MQKPTPEQLAELSRLHNEIRSLKILRRARWDELFAPIRQATKEANGILEKEFDLRISALVLAIQKYRAEIHAKALDWSRAYRLKEFK